MGEDYELQVRFRNLKVKEDVITWSSDNESIATVVDGIVAVHSVGTAYITATSSTGHTAYCCVEGIISPTSFSLEFDEVEVFTAQSFPISVTFEPANCTEKNLTWESSDSNIAGASHNAENESVIYPSFDNTGVVTLIATTDNGLTATITVTVKKYIYVQSVTIKDSINLSFTSKTLYIPYDQDSDTVQLKAVVYPANASYPDVVWTSSNEGIATVDSNGLVTFANEGVVTIKASCRDSFSDSVTLNIKREVLASSISFNKDTLSLIDGNPSVTLVVRWNPTNVTYKNLVWTSSNESVATVTESVNGVVTPVGVGNAIITATTKNGVSATCYVVVNERILPTSVQLDQESVTIEETQKLKLNATVLPDNSTHKDITWSSSDSSIVSVDANGYLQGNSIGTAVITATTINGCEATCNVTVNELTIHVSVYKDGVLVDTLETRRSLGYKIELPQRDADRTTDSSLDTYFFGWFGDEEYSTLLRGDEIFDSDSSIYARNVPVLTEDDVSLTSSGLPYISCVNRDLDVVVVPQEIGQTYIYGLNANAISGDNVKAVVVLGLFSFADSSISNCPNLQRVLIYDYANKNIANRDRVTLSTFSNCPNIIFNTLDGIGYLGGLDEPYKVAIKIEDTSITNLVIPNECFSLIVDLETLMSLESIVVEDGNKYYSSVTGILYDIDQEEILTIPKKIKGDIVIPDLIGSIPDNVFQNNIAITSLYIGRGVTQIGRYALDGCTELVSVLGGDSLIKIGDYSFRNCSKLQACTFNKIREIGNSAFSGCKQLSSFNFVDGLRTIGGYAFKNCRLVDVDIPDTVESILSGAFNGCYTITSLSLPYVGGQLSYDDGDTKYPFGFIFGSDSYNNSIKIMQYYMKSGYSYRQGIEYYIPSNLQSVTIRGGEAFYGAFSNLNIKNELNIYGVTELEDYSLYGALVPNVYIPSTITSIGNYVFSETEISNIYYSGDVNTWLGVSLYNTTSIPNQAATFYLNNQKMTDIKTIDNIDSSITTIKNYSLYGFAGLEKISLNSNIVSIGEYSFAKCSELQEIDIPDGVSSIGNNAFLDCVSMTEVSLGNVVSLEYNAFKGCSGLLEIVVPNSVTSLGSAVFANCSSLSSVTLSTALTSIPSESFMGCSKLVSIDIHNGIETIGRCAFKNCTSLTSFELKNVDVVLSEGVLSGCTSLNSLTISHIGEEDYVYATDRSLSYYFKDGGIPASLKTVTVLGGVLYYDAFNGSVNVETIILKDITFINWLAFGGCARLTSLVINKNFAFDSSDEIFAKMGDSSTGVVITLGKDITHIPAYLFRGYPENESYRNKIVRVEFEEGSLCESIGECAFANSALTSINIPDSVTSIGKEAFYNCGGLLEVKVGENNVNYSSVNGSLYSKDKTTLIQYALGREDTTYEITPNISSIASNAFYGAGYIKTIIYNTDSIPNLSYRNKVFDGIVSEFDVIIGANVTKIPSYLFSSSSQGANVVSLSFVEDSVCTRINEYAFCESKIEVINMSSSVTLLGLSVFKDCQITNYNYIGTLEQYMKVSYGNYYSYPLFSTGEFRLNGKELTSVVVPESITAINNFAFYNISTITSVVMHNNLKSIGGYVFGNCYQLTTMEIPSSVETMNSGIFEGCSRLESLVLNGDVELENGLFGSLFGTEAFENSYAVNQVYSYDNSESTYKFYLPSELKTLTIRGASINSGMFNNITGLTNVALGDDIGIIESNAFKNCTSLESITLSSNITTIDSCAFQKCVALKSVNLPSALSVIGDYAFNKCESLTSIIVPDSVETFGAYAFADCSRLVSADLGDNGGTVLSRLGEYAFQKCSSLTSIDIGEIRTIGYGAFKDCYSLRGIDFPSKLVHIESEAFFNCLSIHSITIKPTIMTIDANAFNECYRLVEVYNLSSVITCEPGKKSDTDGGLGKYAIAVHTDSSEESIIQATDGDYYFANYKDKLYMYAYQGTDDSPSLPEDKGNYVVRKYAFANLDTLTQLTLPSCVVEVEQYSFYKLKNLRYLSCTNAVKGFVGNFIYECNKLETFNFVGSLVDWNNYNFMSEIVTPMYYADEFTLNGFRVYEYTVPTSVTAINGYTFYKFTDLLTVSIHSGVKTIGDSAFRGCDSLSEVKIELMGLVTVGDSVFKDCVKLIEFRMPNTLTNIGASMFDGCVELDSIVFNSNVASIGDSAFANCDKLTYVNIPSSVTSIGKKVFDGCSTLQDLTVSCLAQYSYSYDRTLGALFGNTKKSEEFVAVEQPVSSTEMAVYYLPQSLISVTVRSGVIVKGAFINCPWITNVAIGNGVTFIDRDSFDITSPYIEYVNGIYYFDNWAIKSSSSIANIELRTKTVGVAASAFKSDSKVVSFNTSSELKYICDYAFSGSNVRSIEFNNGLICIGECAFEECYYLQEISLPSSLETLGSAVFKHCKALQAIEVSSSNSYFASVDGDLYTKDMNTLIQYAIGKNAQIFTIPSDVRTIAEYAFSESNIKGLVFGGALNTILDRAFSQCDNLESLVFPDTLNSIGDKAFYSCDNLENISVGTGLNKIGCGAFDKCVGLKEFNFIESKWRVLSESGTEYMISDEDIVDASLCASFLINDYVNYTWYRVIY